MLNINNSVRVFKFEVPLWLDCTSNLKKSNQTSYKFEIEVHPMNNLVCLYIFTHNITKLKYFGKTKVHFTIFDLLKYKGSGIHWSNHIKKHGCDLSVEIYGIYKIEEVEKVALDFSSSNNIVESKEWANLKPENGLDGGDSNYTGAYDIETGEYKKLTRKEYRENKDKYKTGMTGKITVFDISENKYISINTLEYRKNEDMYLTSSQKHTHPKIKCPYCAFEGGQSIKKNHFNNCHIVNDKVPLIDIVHYKTGEILMSDISIVQLNKISLVFKKKTKDNYFGKTKGSKAELIKSNKGYLIGFYPKDKRSIL